MTELSPGLAPHLLTSSLLTKHGFVHAFSTRVGGVSEGSFSSLNLGRDLGDEAQALEENAARFERAIALPGKRLFEVHQVHGAQIHSVVPGDEVQVLRRLEADALMIEAPGEGVAIRTADCLPLLLACPDKGCVAAIHCGWRSVAAGIVGRALRSLCATYHCQASTLVAAIGPHIRLDAFEVGAEVVEELRRFSHGAVFERTNAISGRPHVELAALVRAQLQFGGVDRTRIEDVGGCTFAEPTRFFSHRRDAGRTGRHLSAIVARGRDVYERHHLDG